jgi:prepilin-type N-terminal cleavage/methylation domain-containing protein
MMKTLRTPRAGFTMVEMIVSLVVFAVVIAGASTVMVNQTRFNRDTAVIMDVRNQLRQAAAIMPADLRALSTTGGDLIALTDSAVAFRSTFGTSIACVVTGGGTNTIDVPPISITNGRVFTSWSSAPAVGDSLIVYDEGATTLQKDDTWKAYAITAVSSAAGNCPSSTGFIATADATTAAYKFTIGATPSSTIVAGAPIRFVRRARYSIYKAADNQWYLGYCTGACTSASDRSAIAGPLRAYSSTGTTNGLTIEYLTSAGVATTTPASVRSIRITLRGASTEKIQLGPSQRTFTDQLQFTVGIRNR